MILELPYPPSANRYWRVWRGRAVKSDEAREYQAQVKRQFSRARPLVGPVCVTLEVHRPIKRGDLDNSLKVTLDALKGIAFIDDAQVKRLVATQHDATKATARVEVRVVPLGAPDEFDASDYERPSPLVNRDGSIDRMRCSLVPTPNVRKPR